MSIDKIKFLCEDRSHSGATEKHFKYAFVLDYEEELVTFNFNLFSEVESRLDTFEEVPISSTEFSKHIPQLPVEYLITEEADILEMFNA